MRPSRLQLLEVALIALLPLLLISEASNVTTFQGFDKMALNGALENLVNRTNLGNEHCQLRRKNLQKRCVWNFLIIIILKCRFADPKHVLVEGNTSCAMHCNNDSLCKGFELEK